MSRRIPQSGNVITVPVVPPRYVNDVYLKEVAINMIVTLLIVSSFRRRGALNHLIIINNHLHLVLS